MFEQNERLSFFVRRLNTLSFGSIERGAWQNFLFVLRSSHDWQYLNLPPSLTAEAKHISLAFCKKDVRAAENPYCF